jgi:hypothetical protein
MEAVLDERDKRVNKDISQTEKRYSGKFSPNMLADYCWNLVRETPIGEYKRETNIK